MNHSPAEIVQQMLVDLAQGTLPSANGSWPVFCPNEGNKPDNAITVRDTAGRSDGRLMVTGRVPVHHGFQVRIRASSHNVGWAKADAIRVALSESVEQTTVTISGSSYVVQGCVAIGPIIPLGMDKTRTTLELFTLNALLVVRAL